ncbi:hypothetical protein CH375_03430 [Leptospira ellisii]|uniref:Uncharacterized protein n=1 Tax=Leptospira ellisii TaxID=2023197 RepID=A0A2N0BC06_9LEPT|nr:hypothetical protein CH379_04490 [Leptospira ellisii]PKA05741.1 hypothetical protein CH375_03430 [Leptospira ellisii]
MILHGILFNGGLDGEFDRNDSNSASIVSSQTFPGKDSIFSIRLTGFALFFLFRMEPSDEISLRNKRRTE